MQEKCEEESKFEFYFPLLVAILRLYYLLLKMERISTGSIPRLDSRSFVSSSSNGREKSHHSLRDLTLTHLNAKQHFLIALCRDVSLVLPIFSMFQSLRKAWLLSFETNVLYTGSGLTNKMRMAWNAYFSTTTSTDDNTILLSALTTARSSEYFLASLWCLVSMYLSYSILDSLMVRWIIKYATIAAIFRMFSLSLVILCLEMLLLTAMSPAGEYHLHTWILISCLLTGGYIIQNFITSNLIYGDRNELPLDDSTKRESNSSTLTTSSSDQSLTVNVGRKRKSTSTFQLHWSKRRRLDLYKVTVFCVVPVGFTSFLTMIVLLRNLFIQRLDVEHMERLLRESYLV